MPDGKWEILLYFGNFKNIDLFRQGLYFFRASVYTKENIENKENELEEVKKPFLAYMHFENLGKNRSRQARSGMLKEDEMKENPAEILNGGTQFLTRCLRVQYQQQVTEIKESCLFRVSMPFFIQRPVFIDIDLIFAERHADEYKKRGIKGLKNKFKHVDTTTLVIKELSSMHTMYPVTFSDKYFCLLNLQIHVEFLSLEVSFSSPNDTLSNRENSTVANILSTERQFEIPTKEEWETLETYRKYYLTLLLRTHRSLREIINNQQSIRKEHRSRILNDLGIKVYPIKELEFPGGWERQAERKAPIIKSFYEVLTGQEKMLVDKMTNSEIWCRMTREMDAISANIFEIWNVLVRSVPYFRSRVLRKYFLSWQEEYVERASVVIFREKKLISDRLCSSTKEIEHELMCNKIRKQEESIEALPPPKVQNLEDMVPPKLQAVIFEQSFNAVSNMERARAATVQRAITIKQPFKGPHVIVLVHGYQGSSWDMRLFKNHLQVLLEHTDAEPLFLCSSVNEQKKTEEDIREMGRRLAKEVASFIKQNCTRGKPSRISFVTHSLGGVIARTAFVEPVFKPYIKYLWTFLSLAVCHVGHLFGTVLLRGGLAFLKMWSRSVALTQLSLGDDQDPRKSFMYYLSTQKGLEYFQHVLLISSPADKYCPYHSARIERINQTIPLAEVYNEMCENILKPLGNTHLTRFDVSFAKKQDFWNDQIGRSSHIFFLDQPKYVDMLLNVYKAFFI